MKSLLTPAMLAGLATSLLLSACGNGGQTPDASGRQDKLQVKASITDQPPRAIVTPPSRIDDGQITVPVPVYSSAHFNNSASLGTAVGSPQSGGKGPLAPKFSIVGNDELVKRELPSSNRELLGAFRRSMLESADHLGPVDGHQHAEQETARIAQTHGHDDERIARELSNRLDAGDPARVKPDSSAFPAEKE